MTEHRNAHLPRAQVRSNQRASRLQGNSRRFIAASALLLSLGTQALASPSGRAQSAAASTCPHEAASAAVALGNHKNAARLFLSLLTSHRCPALVWERAAETWLTDAADRPPEAVLQRIEQVAGRASSRLSRRLLDLAHRLRASKLLTNQPGPLDQTRFRSPSSFGATGMVATKTLAPQGRMRLVRRLDAPIWAAPLLGHENAGRQVVYVASSRGTILAIRPSGKQVWRHQAAEPILADLAGIQGVVTVATQNHVLLMDATTGRTLSRFHRPKNCGPPRALLGHIEMTCGTTLYGITKRGLSPLLTQPDPLTAGPVSTGPQCRSMGRADGKLVTVCNGRSVPRVLDVCSGPVVGLVGLPNGSMVAACADKELAAATSRAVLWKVPLATKPTGAIGIGANRIYVGLGDLGLAQFSKTGRYLTLAPTGATMTAGPVSNPRGDLLIAGRDGLIHRWSERSNRHWSMDIGADTEARTLVLDNGSVLVATTDGRILLLE